MNIKKVFANLFYAIFFNIIFALFLFIWVTDDDLKNIPKEPLSRYISLFYYSITSFTTTGYGDIFALSNRMKLIISLYMISIFSITASIIWDIEKHV
jgi:hypothetical protein